MERPREHRIGPAVASIPSGPIPSHRIKSELRPRVFYRAVGFPQPNDFSASRCADGGSVVQDGLALEFRGSQSRGPVASNRDQTNTVSARPRIKTAIMVAIRIPESHQPGTSAAAAPPQSTVAVRAPAPTNTLLISLRLGSLMPSFYRFGGSGREFNGWLDRASILPQSAQRRSRPQPPHKDKRRHLQSDCEDPDRPISRDGIRRTQYR
jgi:hypothetical protein